MKMIEPVPVGQLLIGSGSPKVCVPITGKTKESILNQVHRIKDAMPDIVEWRGDLFDQIFNLEEAGKMLLQIHEVLGEIPILFTFRSKAEGGSKVITKDTYIALNKHIAEYKCVKMVDVEVFMNDQGMTELIEELHQMDKVVVGSHHRFDCTPSRQEMLNVLMIIEESGADILKLAVMPVEYSDVNNLFLTTNEATCGLVSHPVVTMSMGEMGVQSRISGELYGSAMTFACVGEASAPGQMEIGDLRKAMQDVHRLVEKF